MVGGRVVGWNFQHVIILFISFIDDIAFGKPTSQSSMLAGGVSSRAVDGNTSPIYTNGGCTHTDDTMTPHWWAVDLQEAYYVDYVIIYNRGDTCESFVFLSLCW